MTEERSRRLLAQLDLQPGERVLELGAGTSELARQLATAVGPQGHVVANDLAQDGRPPAPNPGEVAPVALAA